MERLTEKRDGQNVIPLRQDGKLKWALCSAGMGNASTQFLYGVHADKLAEFEDLEEQGKLLKLPCEVGSEVWYIDAYEGKHSAKIVRGTVDGYSWFRSCGFALNVLFDEPIMGHFAYKRRDIPFIEIGKTIFLLKPKAETALQKMNETGGTE